MLKAAIVTLVVGLAIGILGHRYYTDSVEKMTDSSGKKLTQLETVGAINFQLPRLNGELFELSSLKGKVVLLNFWATWCAPCAEEFPSLLSLAERYKGEVVIVAVTIDENKQDIENFVKAFKGNAEHLIVVRDVDKKIADSYGTSKLPETYIFNRQFKLARKIASSVNWTSPEAIETFESLLKQIN